MISVVTIEETPQLSQAKMLNLIKVNLSYSFPSYIMRDSSKIHEELATTNFDCHLIA
jgi:hypothetical protein